MKNHHSSQHVIIDYINGTNKPNVGAEANRQQMERVLVDVKGYDRSDIEVDLPIVLDMQEGIYRSTLDLVVQVTGLRFMVIKCAAGSLDSRQREVVAAARLLDEHQIPLAVASDGVNALVWNAVSGQCIGNGLGAVPSKNQALEVFDSSGLVPLEQANRRRLELIFITYDRMNINR